jgi:hypothetical protein
MPLAIGRKNAVHALVGGNLGVHVSQGDSVRFLVAGVGHAAAAEHVVEHDQAARAHQPQGGFVVGIVASLVGIDKDEAEAVQPAFPFELR